MNVKKVSISNYEIVQKLGEGPQSVVYKVFHKKFPERPLVLKVLKVGFLPEYQKLHFRQKIERLKVLNDPLLIRPLSFEIIEDTRFIVREYFDGVPLNEWESAQPKISLTDFFTISCFLVQAVNKVHESGIIYGGLKPHNILIHPKSFDIRLIDFISSIDVRGVSHFIYDLVFVKGTLAYTSPEQTGRINHSVDFSSDLYAMGIIFYELLTRRLPFLSLDPLELIHSHLAEEAPYVTEINPEIPEMVSKIVAKLILKQPEKRYLSATGLLADIIQCRNEYEAKGTIDGFSLGVCDYTRRVTFISKMVGRDDEAKMILDEYNQAAEGFFRSMFISGLPGIGKTRLIQELQKPIVKRRGYFTSGKFDLYQKNIPYSALIQSLRNLIGTFLTESDERGEFRKDKILKTLGTNGRIITEVIPELEVLIGPQSEVNSLPPVEAKNRFNELFGQFLACLANEENPLTIFIDDLQWCDTATFDFLNNLFANHQDYNYLFFIGAYRHNEVTADHHLTRLIRDIKEQKSPFRETRLKLLECEHCHEMVSYILESPLSQTEELSIFIANLSEGNPLFVSEILSYLNTKNLMYLDENRHWQWDVNKIRQSDMPPTVVALFSSRIKKLPAATIELLEYCACMGNRFSPTEIAMIKEITLLNTFEMLKPALAQGFLMENKDDLQFVHDRVQEAVLSAIEPERRRRIHWTVGTRLLSCMPEGVDLERIDSLFNIFSMTAHLNLGNPSALEPPMAYRLSDINYHAGNKALDALASEAANEYFQLARELLSPDCWETQYEKTFKIYQKSAKTELMCGRYDNSEQLLNYLLENAKTNLDRAECLAEQTTSLSSIGNFIKAIETANRGLAYFNKSIPDNAEEAERKRDEIMKDIESKNIDVWNTILNIPFTKDRKSKIELAFYSELIPDLYMSGFVPQFYLSAAQSTQHCLAGGMDESVIYSFSIMGLCLAEKGEFEKAFKYEDLARDLSQRHPNTFGATRGMNGIVWCNAHSRSHPEEIIDYCLKSIQCGKNSGDLYNAGLSYGPLMWNLQVQGSDLRRIEKCAHECLEFSKKYHLYFSVRLAEAMQAGWIEPMKKDHTPIAMDEKLKLWEKDNHVASAGSYYVHMSLVHYYLGEHEKAEECLQGVKKYLSGLTDNVLNRQWHVFLVLNALRLHEEEIKYKTKDELLSYIQPLIKKVETWAHLGPLLRPYLAFIYAELERITGEPREARSLYIDAINLAYQYRYTFLEAHLNECLGELIETLSDVSRFCPEYETCKKRVDTKKPSCDKWWFCATDGKHVKRKQHFEGIKGVFLREAARLYKSCGAQRKEILLIKKYPEYFEEKIPVYKVTASTPALTLPNIDINYLIKSCLIIPAETEENVLLDRIMNVVLESSGAQHGYLVMEERGGLIIRAESHITEKNVIRTTNQKFDDCRDICHAIVHYVNRTKKMVLLDDASEKGEFKDNPEVQEMKLKSVLCLPVIKQNKLVGVLYLENRLSDSVFTAERAAITNFFTYEAAISLENARLLEKMKQSEAVLQKHQEHLEEMVSERTSQLRKTQEDLLIAERLAVLGQLAGSIAHEIRNPLNVISSSAYYIKMKLGSSMDKKLNDHIDRVESEVANSTAIIESLLSLSGMKELKKERLNIISLLKEVVGTSQIPLTIKIVQEITENEIFMEADKEQLNMAFRNVIKNAVQAMDDKGVLTLKVNKQSDEKVKILFMDTGMGIQQENISKLFKPLFTTKARGIGFGLTICKMIVNKHKGVINITSEAGKGTTITMILPAG